MYIQQDPAEISPSVRLLSYKLSWALTHKTAPADIKRLGFEYNWRRRRFGFPIRRSAARTSWVLRRVFVETVGQSFSVARRAIDESASKLLDVRIKKGWSVRERERERGFCPTHQTAAVAGRAGGTRGAHQRWVKRCHSARSVCDKDQQQQQSPSCFRFVCRCANTAFPGRNAWGWEPSYRREGLKRVLQIIKQEKMQKKNDNNDRSD